SGDCRTIIVYHQGDKAVYVYMFPKSAQASLTPNEEMTFRLAAKKIAGLGVENIEELINAGEWIEIDYEKYRKDVPE
ncbi:MAG: type II toxin-antitoxin system RelE/ParE family toxin, partial [Microvirga sp.]